MSDDELTQKIYGLATKYYFHEQVENNGEYRKAVERGREWAHNHIFNSFTIFSNQSDEAYIRDFRAMFSQFYGSSAIRRFPRDNVRVLEIRQDFLRGVKYLLESSDDLNTKIDNLADNHGKYKVRDLGLPVWSYLANAKYPDVPIINTRVQRFFSDIGVDIGKTVAEQVKTVREHYDRWAERCSRNNLPIDYIDFNHMVWFSQTKIDGQQYMHAQFGLPIRDPLSD